MDKENVRHTKSKSTTIRLRAGCLRKLRKPRLIDLNCYSLSIRISRQVYLGFFAGVIATLLVNNQVGSFLGHTLIVSDVCWIQVEEKENLICRLAHLEFVSRRLEIGIIEQHPGNHIFGDIRPVKARVPIIILVLVSRDSRAPYAEGVLGKIDEIVTDVGNHT